MKWYEQNSSEYESLVGKQILREHGASGYGAYIIVKQIIAQNMNDDVSEWGYVSQTETMDSLSQKCGMSVDQFRLFIEFCDQRFIFEKREGRLFCPSILEEKNEYVKKIERRKKTYPDNPDKTDTTDKSVSNGKSLVTTQSHTHSQPQTHLKEKNIKKESSKFTSFEDLTDLVIQEISTKHGIPDWIAFKLRDQMKNWLDSKGKSYKNYKAGFENWVLRAIDEGKIKQSRAPTGRPKLADLIP